jgi:hypothetical protein
MDMTSYNPQNISFERLSQRPKGARLLRDEDELLAFALDGQAKSDLYCWEEDENGWRSNCFGTNRKLTYCTTRPLNWDKERKAPEASAKETPETKGDRPVHVIEAAAVQVPTEREWFIPVIDFAGVGNFWTAYNPRSTLEEAQYVIINARPPGPSLACILRVKLPCRQ